MRNNKIFIDDFYIDYNGIKHPIKGKEKIHITSKDSDEYKVSLLLIEVFGGEIHNVPRITDITNTGIKTSTPDYIWNGERWDLKTPGINGKFENTLERFIKKKNAKLQAKNFIIDYKNFPEKTDQEILNVVNNTLIKPHRNWIENIIIIKNKRILYLKKEPLAEQRPNR